MSGTTGQVGRTARRASNGPWLERGARLGYAARALLYGIIATTALSLALGNGGQTQGSTGALKTLSGQPFGAVLLWAVTAGLAGYALWRIVQAFTTHEDDLAKSIGKRAYYAIRGMLYGALAWSAFQIVSRSGSSGGGSSRKAFVAQALEWPGGAWIVGVVGVVIAGYGAWQWYRAATQSWEDDMKTGAMSDGVKTVVDTAGVVGYLARGVVLAVIGGYLVWGALTYDPSKAIGLDGALTALSDTGYGPWVLGVVAAGLLGFAAFSLAEARYRRIDT